MKMNIEELSAYWDKKWNDIKEDEPNPFALKLIQSYNCVDKPKLLELGCGDGRDLKLFIENGFDVYAVDIATKSIEKLKKRVQIKQIYIAKILKIWIMLIIVLILFMLI